MFQVVITAWTSDHDFQRQTSNAAIGAAKGVDIKVECKTAEQELPVCSVNVINSKAPHHAERSSEVSIPPHIKIELEAALRYAKIWLNPRHAASNSLLKWHDDDAVSIITYGDDQYDYMHVKQVENGGQPNFLQGSKVSYSQSKCDVRREAIEFQ